MFLNSAPLRPRWRRKTLMSYLALASLYSRGLRPLAARAIFAFAAIARHIATMLFASTLWVVPLPKRHSTVCLGSHTGLRLRLR